MWTKEDDEMLEQMSYTHPICPVCSDRGFYIDYYNEGTLIPERKPCENCNM